MRIMRAKKVANGRDRKVQLRNASRRGSHICTIFDITPFRVSVEADDAS